MKKNLLGIVGALAVVLAGCVQMDVAGRGGFVAPVSTPARKQPLRSPTQIIAVQIVQKAPPRSTLNDPDSDV